MQLLYHAASNTELTIINDLMMVFLAKSAFRAKIALQEIELFTGFSGKEIHMEEQSFITDIQTIRDRARHHIEQGAVTDGYAANRQTVLRLLNEALATELVCVLRYKRHYFMASGINAQGAEDEFLQHANDEQAHADQIAQRIVQLDGEPDFSPAELVSRSHSEYKEAGSLTEMIKEDLIAERIAIDSYRDMIRFLGDNDPTTRRMMEGILAVEEEHADDLASLLAGFNGGGNA
jgi:bacterioferritin